MDQGSFSFFVLPDNSSGSSTGSPPVELVIDTEGNPVRKRQPHRKSRFGCTTCKQRKVKCDEASPACFNCRKRNLQCSFKATSVAIDKLPRKTNHQAPSSALVRPQESPLKQLERFFGFRPRTCAGLLFQRCSDEYEDIELVALSSISTVELAPRMNAADRELLLHFETSTAQNLALSRTVWRSRVLRIALQCDYVMSAVLLVAATHMNHNLPAHHPGRRPTLQNFSTALAGLRSALAAKMTISNFECIISCTVLLIHYSWTCMEQDLESDMDLALSFRNTADHFHGLKDCIVVAQDIFVQTEWSKVLLYSPRIKLERYLMEPRAMAEKLEDVFLHCIYCGLCTRRPENASNDNISALSRLILPLSVILISLPNFEGSGVAPDVRRYLFTWPTMGTKGFVLQVSEGNPASLTILLYYYAAILRIYSDEIWWMRDGAMFMFNRLRSKLEGFCDRCIEIPLALLAPPEQ